MTPALSVENSQTNAERLNIEGVTPMLRNWIYRASERMNDIRIKKKLIYSSIFVVFIPVLIVGGFLTAAFRQHVLDQATEQMANNVDRIKSRTSDIIRMPIEISDHLLSDSRLMNVVNTSYETTYDVVAAYREYREFQDYTRLNHEVRNIRFYSFNPTLLENWEFFKVNESIESRPWFAKAMAQDGIHWAYIQDETKGGQRYLSLVRKINFPLYRTSGVLVISIDQQQLNNTVSQEPFDTMVIDDQGYIVAAKNAGMAGRSILELDFADQLTDKPQGVYEFNYDGKPSRIFVEELTPAFSRNGLKIVSVFTIDHIVSGANRIAMLGMATILVSLAVAWILIYMTSSLISKRVLVLNRDMNRVAYGDLNVVSRVGGNDEIGRLSKQFNDMVVSIRRLMEEVAESQDQKSQLLLRQRDIKLKMMASQINPHFLFNALESIRMKAHMKGEKEIAVIVRMLGTMIRKNLEVSSNIRLKDELEIVKAYLEIQKFRYGSERFAYLLDADPGHSDVVIPPLIIQPLVENAAVHGLEKLAEGGLITVSVMVRDDRLRISVKDNGVGIEADRLEDIRRSLGDMEEDNGYRIGLRNVHQRLVMLYGEESGLNIESVPGAGTTIAFELPVGGQQNV